MAGLPEYVRVFTAVELDDEIRRTLAAEGLCLVKDLGKVSLTPAENLHVTLKFVGEVNRVDLADLSAAVAECCRDLRPGEIEVSGAGGFPDLKRPRILWAGVSDPGGILTPVFDALNVAMKAFGAKVEHRRYEPHVTFARVRGRFDGAGFARRVEEAEGLWLGTQAVDAVTLFMSELARGESPRYTALGHYGGGG